MSGQFRSYIHSMDQPTAQRPVRGACSSIGPEISTVRLFMAGTRSELCSSWCLSREADGQRLFYTAFRTRWMDAIRRADSPWTLQETSTAVPYMVGLGDPELCSREG